MDEFDRRLLNRLQHGLPLEPHPYALLAAELDCREEDILRRLDDLLDDGTLTRFGPLFDIEPLGGAFTLAAMSVPEARFEEIAALLAGWPQVAHNYRREHALNMCWWSPATARRRSPRPSHGWSARAGWRYSTCPRRRPTMSACISPSDALLARRLIELTQAGLPLVADPWAWIAAQLRLSEAETLALLKRLRDAGVIRRIAAVPNHYRLGYRHNGMTVWDVADERIERLGRLVGGLSFVSHCYRRPRHLPQWRYNLFAMVHGRSEAEIEGYRQQIRLLLGEDCRADEMLVSSRILKKTGLRLAQKEERPC